MDTLNPLTFDADEDRLQDRTQYSQMDRLLIPVEFQQQAVSTGVSPECWSREKEWEIFPFRQRLWRWNSTEEWSSVQIHERRQGNLLRSHWKIRIEECRSFVMNRFTDKLTPLTDRIFCLRSGSAADTQAIAQVVTYQLDFLA